MKSQLTPEQSQRLIELGVDPSKASEVQPLDDAVSQWTNRGYAILTLSDVLSLLPKEIKIGGIMILSIKWFYSVWFASYIDEDGSTTNGFYGTELIDALYELLCWTLTREKNEKGKQ